MAEKVLEISTLRNRRKVSIDGVAFEMLDGEELNLSEGIRLRSLIDSMKEASKLTPEEGAKMTEDLKSAVNILLIGLPEDKANKLNDNQRLSIILSFLQVPAKPKADKTEKLARQKKNC